MLDDLLAVCVAALVVTTLYGLYHAVVGLRFAGTLPRLPDTPEYRRFAVLVFARDEERVIGQLLSSLRAQDYPADRFDVFVTADHCADGSAAIARAAGAVVHERSGSGASGKGAALAWFFDHHFPDGYDACVVFDADNIVDPGYLAAMNRQLAAGHPVALGYRLGKNPSSSWVAGASTLFWLVQSRFLHQPRARWGLPCTSVGGTGFMFATRVLGPAGWRTRSACEDIEFTLQVIAAGHFVAFARDAVFYDEQPLTLGQSLRQRYRWSVGSTQLIGISVPPLLARVRRGRPAALDAVLFVFGAVAGGVSTLAWLASVVLGLVAGVDPVATLVSLTLSTAVSYLALVVFALLVLRLERVRWPGMVKAVLGFPVWLSLWSVLNLIVLFHRDPTWHVVPHNDALSLPEMTVRHFVRPEHVGRNRNTLLP